MSPARLPALALLVATTLAVPASAAFDPGATCLAAKLRAAGKATRRLLACHAVAAKKGLATDAACVAKAQTKLGTAYADAQAHGGCIADDGLTRADLLLLDLATETAARLRPSAAASVCQSVKLGASGRLASSLLAAHARNVAVAVPAKVASLVSAARAAFAASFGRAETKGDCLTTADAAVAAPSAESFLDGVMAALRVVRRDTIVLPSPVAPANTPGSPGVTVTNPKLLTQLGAGANLNNVQYTRWRLNGPERTPDAVLVMIAGFGGGAGNFEILAENLIGRALEDHGLLVELWGYDRRTEQLEDRAGVLIAGALQDPLVALDWFYGTELGLTLHPALVAGPNRLAVFYNTTSDVPFISSWTSLVFSRDVDVVVGTARATARQANVFLGGHSAGTGFAARYAATDFDLTGAGPAEPGYARLRGLVLFEGGGGTTASAPLTNDSLDRVIAKFDGGLFGAVRDGAGRCVDGTTACTVPNEATECTGQVPPVCTPATAAHGVLLGLSPKVLAAAEPAGIQALTDLDGGQAILQADQGSPGNNAVAKVPELALLTVLPPGTVGGLFGSFLDDESLAATASPAFAAAMGAPGPVVGGLLTWLDRTESAGWPACPGTGCVTPDNGLPPTALPGGIWGREHEAIRLDRLVTAFAGVEGANSSDWYYPLSGLSVTTAAGTCAAGVCTRGNVGASCANNAACGQAISLDSTALSVGRGRRDIENLTQAPAIDLPVLAIGGSNGLTPVPARYTAFAQSIGPCTRPSCTGTARLVDPSLPSPAFPTFGGTAGGFEVVIAEGFAHIDVVAAEDDAENPIVGAVADFIARNVE